MKAASPLKIIKILNNNAAVSADTTGKEIIVMGKGLAFGKKVHDSIDSQRIEKIFSLSQEDIHSKFKDLAVKIPVEHILLAEKIILYAKERYNFSIHESIYISLSDHISTAIYRFRNNMPVKNPLLQDIKCFFPQEFKIGMYAVERINTEHAIDLTEDEVGFIAMHFVNGGFDGKMNTVVEITDIIHEIMDIIRNLYALPENADDITLFRFSTHLKFFAYRILHNMSYPAANFELYTIVAQNYTRSLQGALQIKDFVEKKYHFPINTEELTYLTLHIARLTKEGVSSISDTEKKETGN